MPKISPDALLQSAIRFAVLDREWMVDSLAHMKGPEYDAAVDQVARVTALTGRKFESFSDADMHTAMLTFIWAEQWESSLAQATPGEDIRKRCVRNVERFKAFRHHVWGMTKLEKMDEEAKTATKVWRIGPDGMNLVDVKPAESSTAGTPEKPQTKRRPR